MAPFDQLADRVSAALWNLHPVWAVRLGKHEYDGQVPDLSADAREAVYDRLRRLQEQLTGLVGLDPDRRFESAVLAAALECEVWAGEGPAGWSRSPVRYLEPLDTDAYLGRDFAPAGLRLERAAEILERAGEVLAVARTGLEPGLSRAAIGWARERCERLAGRLERGPSVVAGTSDPAALRRWQEAAAGAVRELRAYAGWLEAEEAPAAGDIDRLGADRLERVLWEGGPAGRSLEQVAALARRALIDDRAALEGLGGGPGPGAAASPPTGGGATLVSTAVAEALAFVRRAEVARLPEEVPLRVAEDAGLPAGGVRLDPPGPYDDPAAGAVLYVGSGEGRPEAGRWRDLAVAAGYPGRLLAARRRAGLSGEVRRRFVSRGSEEGWARWAGEAMWEAGYRHDDPAWRRVWLGQALRAGCRLACAVEVHAGEMSLEQAEGFFMEQAGVDATVARGEAVRVAADPGCASGALGRLEIRDLRRRWAERFPDRGSGAFHDALLDCGAPPLGLLAEEMRP